MIPDVDVAFALSSSAVDANENFQQMKDIIKAMVEAYGKQKVHYSLITFGDTPSVKVKFSELFPTDDMLKGFIDAIPRSSGTPALAKALDEARKLFEDAASRENATKILVVMMDNKSGSEPEDVKEKGKALEEAGIRVIAVAVGNQADVMELNNTTPHEGDVITTDKTGDPDKTAKEIMEKGLEKRKFEIMLIAFLCRLMFSLLSHIRHFQIITVLYCIVLYCIVLK